MKIYIAGPMTGVKNHNFPLFNAVAASLRSKGIEVVNPAELDAGESLEHPWDYYLRRDLKKLVDCDTICLLENWEKSRGARLEKHVADALGMGVRHAVYRLPSDDFVFIEAQKPGAVAKESVLQEAQRLVGGDRGQAYGHPADDMGRTGRMWAAILGIPEVTAAEVALCMVAVKISREVNAPKRDNRVDGPGYFLCLDMIRDREEK